MTRNNSISTLRTIICVLCGGATLAIAGDLMPPPGPIGPTMKRLSDIEPRTPISSLPFAITQPGSYYLTGNLTGVTGQNGITLAASDVTIDLMGFALYGVPGSLDGIATTMLPISVENVTIRNGTVRNWGGNGVSYGGPSHIALSDIVSSRNVLNGLMIGGDTCRLTSITVEQNGQDGLIGCGLALVSEVKAKSNGGRGIVVDKSSPQLYKALSAGNGGDGIVLGKGAECRDCTAGGNGGIGINKAVDQASVKLFGCHSEGNSGDGIVVGENATIQECAAIDNGGHGIVADKSSPKLYQCLASGNTGGDGIVLGDDGTCENCMASNNTGRGIVADKSSPKLEKAHSIGNGGDGIVLGENATCNDCIAQANTGRGILADKSSPKLYQCLASGNTGGDGIVLGENATCNDCTAQGNTGRGIVADKASPKLYQCLASGNTGGAGIVAGTGVDKSSPKLLGCHSKGNSGDGIVAGDDAVLENCSANSNAGRGIVTDKSSPQLHKALAVGNGGDGLVLGENASCENCTAEDNTGRGIIAEKSSPQLHKALAIGNGGDGILVTDNNVPPKSSTAVLKDCTARGNGGIGFNLVQPPVARASANATDGSTPAGGAVVGDQLACPAFANAERQVARGPARRDLRATALLGTAGKALMDGCLAEENVGDGFSLDGEWTLSQCVGFSEWHCRAARGFYAHRITLRAGFAG